MNKIDTLLTFITTVNEGSLAKAAKKLNLSIPAISKQISALEKHYAVSLFFRERKGLKLSDPGVIFFEQAKEIVANFTDAEAKLFDAKEQVAGNLKVVCAHFFATRTLLPKLNEFCDMYPSLRLTLEISERIPDMEKEGLDLVCGMSVLTTENILRRQIGESRYVLCASKDYLKKMGEPKSYEDLANHRFIAHSIRAKPSKLILKDRDIEVKDHFLINHSLYFASLLREGFGLGQILEYMVEDDLKNGDLVEILAPKKKEMTPTYLFTRNTNFKSEKVQRFIDFFIPKDQYI